MKVRVYNHFSGGSHILEGSPQHVEAELLRIYPWLRSEDPEDQGDVRALVEELDSAQAFDAEVLEDTPMTKAEPAARNLPPGDEGEVLAAMLGYHHKLMRHLDAARFLSGGQPANGDRVRQALWEADGDPEETALVSHGLEPSEANLKALRAVYAISEAAKGEGEPATATSVEPGHPDASETAQQVLRAFQDRFVMPVKLGGKHSAGSLLARDRDTGDVWLLKPGSGGQSPAAGAKEDPSTQSRREAAFWHMADAWGLSEYYPRADLLLIDGHEFAALRLLPWAYKGMDKLKEQDPVVARRTLEPYLKGGILFRWAVLDAVLGNPDRHAGNLMVHAGDVKLIDHGSAMAGAHFDPAHDKNSFTPFYLRAWAPGKFSTMAEADKLKYMPRLDRQSADELRSWIDGLHADDLDRVLLRYGVDPQPAKERLARLKMTATSMPADEAVNRFWAEV